MEKVLGLLNEGKNPPDKRVALTPQQCAWVQEQFGVRIIVQKSTHRSFSDHEYKDFDIELVDDLSSADWIMGIKEVPLDQLLENKTYLFFSHTIKEQPYNQKLLQALRDKKIKLIDYECLTDKELNRVIGFGRYAGIVGAYNGLLGYGKRYGLFDIKPANECFDKAEMEKEFERVKLPNIKIAITGGGRVANGAIEVLGALKLRKVTPYEYLNYNFREPVYTQLHSRDYHVAKAGGEFDSHEFYAHPEKYDSTFYKYAQVTDLLMHSTFWDPKAPVLFTPSEMRKPDFKISVIADLSCDIKGGCPATLRATSIAEPFMGYNPFNEEEYVPFSRKSITIMAVDNLPCELPRDASEDFGKNLMERVFPALLAGDDNTGMIDRGTIIQDGQLMDRFKYLQNYLDGKTK